MNFELYDPSDEELAFYYAALTNHISVERKEDAKDDCGDQGDFAHSSGS